MKTETDRTKYTIRTTEGEGQMHKKTDEEFKKKCREKNDMPTRRQKGGLETKMELKRHLHTCIHTELGMEERRVIVR